MMRVWSHRPKFLHLGLFIAAYVLGCGFAQSLAIVPGTGISIWPPGGLFIATLVLAPRQSWLWWVLGGCLAELFSNFVWFHSPLPAAFLIYVGNALGAMTGAWLVTRASRASVRLETLQDVLAFVVLAAGVAPVVSATAGSATLQWFAIQSQTFAEAWPLWWIGDATGILIVAPLALVVVQNWRGEQLSTARWMEAAVLALIFLGVAALSLSGYLPFAYMIMPPLLWTAVRFEFKGAAVSLLLLALITAVFTISGDSQFAGDPESQRDRQVMLQLFLAISAFSALVVAAISRQHQLAMLTLRQNVEALRRSEQQLQQMIDAVPVRIWSATPAGGPVYFNKRYQDHFRAVLDGFDRLDKPGIAQLLQELVHPDDTAEVQRALEECFATGNGAAMRFRWREKDGVYRWAECRVEARRDEDGSIAEWYGVSLDIDDEVRAQQALRERERELSQLVNMVPSHVWRLTAEGEPTFINKRLGDFLGLDVEDYDQPGMNRLAGAILTSAHPEDAPVIAETIGHSLVTGETFSMRWRVRRADGVYRWVDSRAEPLRDESGAITQWFGVNVDIDDQMAAQQALRDREREFSHLVNMVPIPIWRLAPSGEPTFFNKRLIDFLGLDVAEYEKPGVSPLAAAIETVVHPDDAARVSHALNHSLATGENYALRYRLRRADGIYRWMEVRAEPMRDENGRILQWYGLANDIEDQLRAEEAIRESEEQLRRLVDALPTQIWAATAQGEPSYLNRRLAEYVGLTLSDLDMPDSSRLQVAIQSSVHPDDAPSVGRALVHSFGTGETFSMKYRQRRADGIYRWINGRAEPLRDADGQIVQWYGVSFDVDDEVRTQEELRRTQERLAIASQAASLAELSASIAHEVNQPLAAVVANSHACERWLTADPPNLERAQRTVERIIRDANAAADVVSRIRALFRQSVETRTGTMLASVVAEARSLIAEEATRRSIRLDVGIEDGLPPVAIDRIQIQQVLINLMRNGMEATSAVIGDRVLAMRVRRAGEVIETRISDHGSGIAFPDRIFEPFFTTKGHGMGMGLAICRSIVESHGGRLWAENNEPQGAVFVFTLPIQAKAAP
ncbi:MASE1 domain-containing protein [Devosia nitrariae]|uniref:histidine kinase n=1 Tax=Devosia nitrariae TaxID=2071872 RepID=A0ABQ5WBU9_9HYPH|nr:MASE1 domain-containing protein [Devosia nitrariae]GLQ57076.1 hypothetical protein GCM10010862_43350 [Devosia nitrariae]